jgi:uncharacterized phiE125 gp8 family phage protein
VERVAACALWMRLLATPLRGVSHVYTVPPDGGAGVEVVLPAYGLDIDSCGDAFVRMSDPGDVTALDVHFTAGIADDWASVPQALRQGIVRLTAHLFAERDSNDPPAIVAALWRPWRRMRLR